MPYFWALVSVLVFTLRQTVAQSISDVPQCAENAAFSSISSTGCQLTDIECICKDQSFINSLLPVVKNDCNAADLQKTIAFTQSLCKTVGITVSIPTSASNATSTGTPLILSTTSIVSGTQAHTTSGSPSNKSTSTKPTAPTSASVTASSGSSSIRGAAARYYAQNVCAGAGLALIGLSLL